MDGSVSRRGASDTTKFAEAPLWNSLGIAARSSTTSALELVERAQKLPCAIVGVIAESGRKRTLSFGIDSEWQ